MTKKDISIQEAIELRNQMDEVIGDLLNKFYDTTGLSVESMAIVQVKISANDEIIDIKHRVITSVGIKGHFYE